MTKSTARRPKMHFHYERKTFQDDGYWYKPQYTTYNPLTSDYELLGIYHSATDDEVRRAYRRTALKYHPDRYATANEETRMRAERLFKAVNEAKERIYNARGMR